MPLVAEHTHRPSGVHDLLEFGEFRLGFLRCQMRFVDAEHLLRLALRAALRPAAGVPSPRKCR